MVLTPEQTETIKKSLIEQIEKSDQPNKEQIISYIKELNESQLEEFLKQNKIQIKGQENPESPVESESAEQKCIFCSITKNEIPSYKIAETKKAIAILEINPLSKGHSIVLPLEHTTIEKIPKSILSLAQKIAKKIKKKLKPEDIKIETSSLMGHAMINIVPLYKEPLNKTKATEEELKKLQSKLETKKRAKRTASTSKSSSKSKTKKDKKIPKISFRIP